MFDFIVFSFANYISNTSFALAKSHPRTNTVPHIQNIFSVVLCPRYDFMPCSVKVLSTFAVPFPYLPIGTDYLPSCRYLVILQGQKDDTCCINSHLSRVLRMYSRSVHWSSSVHNSPLRYHCLDFCVMFAPISFNLSFVVLLCQPELQ